MPNPSPHSTPVTELKVSGHLMTLEPGVFCVFNAPGAVPPDVQTGLPGVRISAAPAPAGFPGAVALSGFSGDGWLGGADGAALIRVTGGPAQVLVTVYQSPASSHEAPQLQVMRLNGAAAPAAPAAAVEVGAHIYGRGDVGGRLGDWMGERGSKRWIEGFGLQPESGVPAADLEYQAVLGRGWMSPWTEGGQFCGSRGMSLPILGLKVRLRGASAATHQLAVSATFVDGTAVGPVSGDEACEAPSLAALEAFQVVLSAAAPRSRQAPAAPPKPAGRKRAAAPAAAPPEPAPAPPAQATPKPKSARGRR